MSQETQAWAKLQRTGDPITRAVLVELGNWAKPTGIVEFLSIDLIATAVEVSPRTVKRHIAKLETSLGLIKRVERFRDDGGRGANGFVLVGYEAPAAGTKRGAPPGQSVTPPGDRMTRGGCQDVTEPHDTGDTRLGDKILPLSDADASDPPQGDEQGEEASTKADRARGTRVPDGWTPPRLSELPPQARACVDQWPSGAYEAEAEAFFNYWSSLPGKGARKLDWPKTWANRIVAVSAKVLRDGRAGVKHQAPAAEPGDAPEIKAVPEQMIENGQANALRAALRKDLGKRHYDTWFAPAALLIQGDVLRVIVGSQFSANYIEANFQPQLSRAIAALTLPVTLARTEVTNAIVCRTAGQ